MTTPKKDFKEEDFYNNVVTGTKEVNKQKNQPPIKTSINESRDDKDKNIENVNEKKQKIDAEELITATCFSSEAENKFQSKGLRGLNTFIQKQFEPPQITGNSKWQDLKARLVWTIIMLIMFGLFILAGSAYCGILVLLIMVCIFMELTDLNKYRDRNLEIKWYYPLSWYIFILSMYYFNIRAIRENLIFLEKYKVFQIMIKHHNFICFNLYCVGFAIFLKSLTKGYYRYQFSSFAYNHLIILMLSLVSGLLLSNIFSGLFWFVLPCGMVICNDISAYVWGRMFGRTMLTELSPKKTVEGFVGAFFTTIVYAIIISEIFMKYGFLETFLCPTKEITFSPFIFNECDISRFRHSTFSFLGVNIKDIQLHTFAVAFFTSTIAPMGGFFASGFKRAIKIKDFSNIIPGHGGFTDRMDCQLLVGVFTSLWLTNFVYFDSYLLQFVIRLLEQVSDEGKFKILEYLTNIQVK